MKTWLGICVLLFTALGSFASVQGQEVYDARIGEKEILTPAPAPTPRINGP